MSFETKHTALELKLISTEGTFEGLLSPYGNVDQGNDIVLAGAFSKNLAEKGLTRPLLSQHDTKNPIGTLTLADKSDGLYARGQLLLALPEAQKAYALIKGGIVGGLSIGFRTVRDEIKNGIRQLKEL